MDNIEIGKRIKYARDIRNATLDSVAQKVGVAKSTIQRYENGKIEKVKIPVIESIATALNVNPMWLVGKSDDISIYAHPTPTIMMYYERLNDLGKHEATKRVQELTYLPQYSLEQQLNAAHERPDATPEDKAADNSIMDDANF